jgi:L-threonylcarbamoyladenylate synthase
LCYRFQKAVVSTSANVSGEPSPACFDDISDEIKNAVDYIVQSRRKEKTKAVPSSIIKLGSDGEVAIIRK